VSWVCLYQSLKFKVSFSTATLTQTPQRPELALPLVTYGMKLRKIAARVATSGECEFAKFAFSCIHFVVHPSALQPYEGL